MQTMLNSDVDQDTGSKQVVLWSDRPPAIQRTNPQLNWRSHDLHGAYSPAASRYQDWYATIASCPEIQMLKCVVTSDEVSATRTEVDPQTQVLVTEGPNAASPALKARQTLVGAINYACGVQALVGTTSQLHIDELLVVEPGGKSLLHSGVNFQALALIRATRWSHIDELLAAGPVRESLLHSVINSQALEGVQVPYELAARLLDEVLEEPLPDIG